MLCQAEICCASGETFQYSDIWYFRHGTAALAFQISCFLEGFRGLVWFVCFFLTCLKLRTRTPFLITFPLISPGIQLLLLLGRKQKKNIGEVIRRCFQFSVKAYAEIARLSSRFADSVQWQPLGDSKRQADVIETKSYSHTLAEETQQGNHVFFYCSLQFIVQKKSLLCLSPEVTLYTKTLNLNLNLFLGKNLRTTHRHVRIRLKGST